MPSNVAAFSPPEAIVEQWVAAFRADPPLHTLFPVVLNNGKSVPGVNIVCSTCRDSLSGDRIHGRVVQSLPHVVTVHANGYCQRCNRLTNVRCRFRTEGRDAVVEWPGSDGRWRRMEYLVPTRWQRLAKHWRRFLARLNR